MKILYWLLQIFEKGHARDLTKEIRVESDKQVEEKRTEAHDLKNKMTTDILRIQKKVDKINKDTNAKLQEVSIDLKTVTYNIAVATGGKKRGLQ